ncbi:MAG: cyclase family protein [Paracholeplasma sp.]|uniref:Cyclase family protein n=1 Tax=Acholeplasma brassicae TaxID=61635 RepID=U4KSA1_9MOLU|nr:MULTISPECIES: cyclase family protein [Paracholeplasma]MDY3196646.1 cyclase family protein [Paracholeplasma sp.]CCV66438.1 Cyclase family protein [Paracholeplasma brassicae]
MLIDLSLVINNELKSYPGDPRVKLQQIASIEKDGFNNYELSINMHAGTHIDGPKHMDGSKKNICDYALDRFHGKARIVNPKEPYQPKGEQIVVIPMKNQTLSEGFIKELIRSKINLIVIDKDSIDEAPYPLHKLLFKNNVFIVENAVNLHLLEKYPSFTIFAIPLKIEADSSLIRLFAQV